MPDLPLELRDIGLDVDALYAHTSEVRELARMARDGLWPIESAPVLFDHGGTRYELLFTPTDRLATWPGRRWVIALVNFGTVYVCDGTPGDLSYVAEKWTRNNRADAAAVLAVMHAAFDVDYLAPDICARCLKPERGETADPAAECRCYA